MAEVTYYVALPFIMADDGPAPNEGVECMSANAAIMRALAEVLGVPVLPVEAEGWNGDALEAQCFGFLAVRVRRGLPLSLPTTTGVPHPMAGGRLALPSP